MANNSIQPWANGNGANRLTDAAYKRWDKSHGFDKGTASSEQANTLWAANSLVASAIGQFTADGSGKDVSLDMSRDDLVSAFKEALGDFMLNGAGSTPMTQMPVGTPIIWHSDDIPAGTLLMNGQAIDAEKYPKLHDIYGDHLPDWRGYFLRASDHGRGIDEEPNRAAGSIQDSANKSHAHDASTGEAGEHTPSGSVSSVEPHTHPVHDYYLSYSNDDESGSNKPGLDGVDSAGKNTVGPRGTNSDSVWLPYKTHNTELSAGQDLTFSGNKVNGHTHTVSVNNSGGKESRPKNIAVNYIVVAA